MKYYPSFKEQQDTRWQLQINTKNLAQLLSILSLSSALRVSGPSLQTALP